MKREIVVVNKGVDKKDLAVGFCCFGALLPLLESPEF